MVRAVDAGEPVTIDRQVRVVLLQGPVADVVEVTVSVTRGVIDRWEHRARRAPAAPDGRVDHGAGGAARASGLERRARTSRHRRHVARADRPLAGRHLRPGPRGGPPHHALPGLSARVEGGQRLRPAARGPAGVRRHGAGRGARGGRPRDRARPADPRELLRRAQRADAHGPQAAGDRAARWAELRGRGQSRALAEMVDARRHGPAGGSRALDASATRTADGSGPSSTAPRSARWSSRTVTPGRCTPGRAPSTPASGAWAAWRTR